MAALIGATWAADPVAPAPSVDELTLEQQRAGQRMDELESRLHTLAGLLRDEEPENAGRLLLALQASRRDGLKDEMAQIRGLLQAARTGPAAARADALILKLNELRELLTASNIRFRLQLERLRGMMKSRESIAALRAAEAAARAETDKLAGASAEQKQAGDRQNQLAERTAETTAAMSTQFAGTPASRTAMQQAEQAMRQAGQNLQSSENQEAGRQQDQALSQLDQADDALRQEIEKLRQEMESEVRAMVLETLKNALSDEESVVAATQAGNHGETVRGRQRGVGEAARQLAAVVRDTGYSAALPVALDEIAATAAALADNLKNTLAQQQALASTIKMLIDTIEERPAPTNQDQDADGNQNPQQQGEQQKQNLQKLLAELRMLHFLESRILAETRAAEKAGDEAAADALGRRQVQVLEAVRNLQESIRQQQGQQQ